MEQILDWHLTKFSSKYNHKSKTLNTPYPTSPVLVTDFGTASADWVVELCPVKAATDEDQQWDFHIQLRSMKIKSEGHVPKVIMARCKLFIIVSSGKATIEPKQYTTTWRKFCFDLELEAVGKKVKLGWPGGTLAQPKKAKKVIDHLGKYVDTSNDSLHVRVNFKCTTDDSLKTLGSPRLTANLVKDLGGILASGQDADVVIKCNSDSFPVHKLILTLRSPVFRRMFQSNMIEGSSGIIKIEDMEPVVVKQFLNFLYTAEVTDISHKQLIGLITAGDKYEVAGLKEICFQHLVTQLEKGGTSCGECAELAVTAHLHGADASQKNAIFEFVSVNWKTLGVNEKFQELVKAYPEAFLKELKH